MRFGQGRAGDSKDFIGLRNDPLVRHVYNRPFLGCVCGDKQADLIGPDFDEVASGRGEAIRAPDRRLTGA